MRYVLILIFVVSATGCATAHDRLRENYDVRIPETINICGSGNEDCRPNQTGGGNWHAVENMGRLTLGQLEASDREAAQDAVAGEFLFRTYERGRLLSRCDNAVARELSWKPANNEGGIHPDSRGLTINLKEKESLRKDFRTKLEAQLKAANVERAGALAASLSVGYDRALDRHFSTSSISNYRWVLWTVNSDVAPERRVKCRKEITDGRSIITGVAGLVAYRSTTGVDGDSTRRTSFVTDISGSLEFDPASVSSSSESAVKAAIKAALSANYDVVSSLTYSATVTREENVFFPLWIQFAPE